MGSDDARRAVEAWRALARLDAGPLWRDTGADADVGTSSRALDELRAELVRAVLRGHLAAGFALSAAVRPGERPERRRRPSGATSPSRR